MTTRRHPGRAARIDATGHVVAPGFIDLHSHSGLMILAEPRHEPKVRQGVTTEIFGVDGNSYAPFRRHEDLLAFVELNSGLDGRPDARLRLGHVADYLALFDRQGQPSTSATWSATPCCASTRSAGTTCRRTRAALDQMRGDAARGACRTGAFGVSSGLDYPPGAYATTDELAELTAEAATLGGIYHTHVRYALGDRFLDPFREAIEIGRRSGGPCTSPTSTTGATFPGTPEQMIELVEDARAEGLDVTWDTYPYEWASTRLLIMLPPWVQEGGPGPLKERLARPRDPRAAARARSTTGRAATRAATRGTTCGSATSSRPEAVAWEGRTLGDVMAETGKDVVDALCDLLLAEDLGVSQVTPGPWTGGLPPFLRHPSAWSARIRRSSAHKPSPRTYGSFPRILGEFVRDMRLMPLEEAVRKMTSAPAARLGITDRGRLADGMKADIVVFDPATVRATAT